MELRSNLFTQTKQSLAITSGMIQSIQLLKFGQEDLFEFLREQEESNPLIEVVGRPDGLAAKPAAKEMPRQRDVGGRSAGVGGATDALSSLEETFAEVVTLRRHLLRQSDLTFRSTADRMIAAELVEAIEPDGYMRGDLDEIADELSTSVARVEAVLEQVQRFDPAGVGARNLGECLSLQLRETGRLTPQLATLLDNLSLLAQAKHAELAKLCDVSLPDVAEMAREIRDLDPRPGLQYDADPVLPALPDLKVDFREDGSFHLELNSDLLPRVLVDREYYAEMRAGSKGTEDAHFVVDCMKDANWLIRNLDQRANTILKVATEIVKQQKEFFLRGVEYIKPLCQGDVADAVGIHRSTVCRATAGKYILTNRGMFELNFFFSNALASADGDADHSAESVRAKIRALVEAETAKRVLSDDALMMALRNDGVEIARRTVAKYREMMNIPSSQVRKRLKRAAAAEQNLCSA